MRHRSTKWEVEDRREQIAAIVAAGKPMTVRQVFYLATVHDLVPKTERGYAMVQHDLTLMRRDECNVSIPYGWLVDHTRWQRKPKTFSNMRDAVNNTAKFYRKALWDAQDCYLEIWLEKEALSGVIYPVTEKFDVPLMVAKGYASLSFLHDAAEAIEYIDKETYIYHFGDYDPSGVDAARRIEQSLQEMAPGADITFERIAVTPEQISSMRLPSRPTKQSDTRAAAFGSDDSVELDAIEPNQLREIVRATIEDHIDFDQLAVTQAAEKSEQQLLKAWAIQLPDKA